MVVLFNWLTQGIAVAIATAAGLRVIAPARSRYRFVSGAYLLIVALPLIPWLSPGPVDVPGVDLPGSPTGPMLVIRDAWWTGAAMALGCWVVWAAVQMCRLTLSVRAVRRAKRRGIACGNERLAPLPHWSRIKDSGRHVPVILSDDVRFAAVLGCGAPVIAISPALFDQLDAADLDRVLVHEWAHVQRRDDVAQLLQQVAHAIIGWQPAAWWLARQIAFEREAACDAVAVRITESARDYAACLATLVALPKASPLRPVSALAALPSSDLEHRLIRILAPADGGGAGPRRALNVAAGVGLLGVGFVAGNVETVAFAATAESLSTAAFSARVESVAAAVLADAAGVPAAASERSTPNPSHASRARVIPERSRPSLHAVNAPGIPASPPIADIAVALLPLASTTLTGDRSPDAPQLTGAHVPIHSDTGLPAADAPARRRAVAPAPGMPAADAGIAMGRRSQRAGVATAGFFVRVGKGFARSF